MVHDLAIHHLAWRPDQREQNVDAAVPAAYAAPSGCGRRGARMPK